MLSLTIGNKRKSLTQVAYKKTKCTRLFFIRNLFIRNFVLKFMRYYKRYFCSVVNFNNRKQKKIYLLLKNDMGKKQATSVSFFQETISNFTSDQIQLELSRNKILKFNKGGGGF